MKKRTIWLIGIMLCLLMPVVAFSQDFVKPVLTSKADMIYVKVGGHAVVQLTLVPQEARAKGVTYASDAKQIATVSEQGVISAVSVGGCNILVTSKYDRRVSIKIPVQVVQLAESITVSAKEQSLKVGESLQLEAAFLPEDTSVPEAEYRSSNPRLATVDEKGIVTGIAPGRVSIIAAGKDGGRARGKITIQIMQPVTGVSYKTPHVRVGARSSHAFTVAIEPKNATNRKMTWVSEDESIATVTGTTNHMRIRGIKWGQTTVTGTTEDGSFQISLTVNIGNLNRAVIIYKLEVKNGKPRIVFKNNSNLNIVEVRYVMKGYDGVSNQIQMGRKKMELKGIYDYTLEPGDFTKYGAFTFSSASDYSYLTTLGLAITGWSTEDGYYNNLGELVYDFNLSGQSYDWGWGN